MAQLKEKKIPERTCVGCGRKGEKKSFVRILKTPEDTIVLDATGRMNGRGAYLCGSRKCLELAVKKKALSRSLKVPVPPEVIEEIRKQLPETSAGEADHE